MDAFDVMGLGVEASIVLAGFSGIVATFQFSGSTKVRRAPVAALTIIVQLSLLCALAAAIPLVLYTFDIENTTLWGVCSSFGVIFYIMQLYITNKNFKGSIRKLSVRLMFRLFQGLCALALVTNALNVANVVFHREPGPYVAGTFLGLIIAAVMFSRLLLLPLWRRVREQEALDVNGAGAG